MRRQSTVVEPLNSGHIGTSHSGVSAFIERLSSLRRLKCTSIIEGPRNVAIKERFFLLRPLFGVSTIRGATIY